MTILSDRWKGLRKIPYVSLGELPTPIERLSALEPRVGAQLFIKREDRTSNRYGGNKVRKLEYLIGEALAQRADTFVTAGAAGSHHVVASGLYGPEHGLKVHAVVIPQRFTTHVEEHLRAALALGVEIHAVGSQALLFPMLAAVVARLRARGRRVFVVGPGGSDASGTIGYVEAGLELARQMESGVCPELDAIFVPYGSGGTAAGLAVGLAACGITTPVIAVRATGRLIARQGRLEGLVDRVVERLRSLDGRFPDVAAIARSLLSVDGSELGDGYGEPTETGRNAARLMREHAGIELDATYTAKTFACALRRGAEDLRGRRILYLHTLSTAPLEPHIGSRPPPLPRSLQSLLAHP